MKQKSEKWLLSDGELTAIAGGVGGSGKDFLLGGSGNDLLLGKDAERVRFQRNNLGLFTLDIGTTENL